MTATTLGRCRDCPDGTLVVVDIDDEFWTGECNAGCGGTASVHRNRVDPAFRRLRRRDQADIPAEFAGVTFQVDDDNREAVGKVRGWVDAYGPWLRARRREPLTAGRPPAAPALWGRQGRGKSHLLAAVCEWLIDEHDAGVLVRSARALLRDLQDFDGDADRAFERAVTVDVLALDDLGAQQITDWKLDRIADLIDERYQRRLPLLVATNPPPGAWEQMLDLRTVSRLRGMTFPVELDSARDRRRTVEHRHLRPVPEQ